MPDVIIPRRWLKRHFNRQTEKEGEVVTSLSVDNRISLDGIFFLNDRGFLLLDFRVSGRGVKRYV